MSTDTMQRFADPDLFEEFGEHWPPEVLREILDNRREVRCPGDVVGVVTCNRDAYEAAVAMLGAPRVFEFDLEVRYYRLEEVLRCAT